MLWPGDRAEWRREPWRGGIIGGAGGIIGGAGGIIGGTGGMGLLVGSLLR